MSKIKYRDAEPISILTSKGWAAPNPKSQPNTETANNYLAERYLVACSRDLTQYENII